MLPIEIRDGNGNQASAHVSEVGELAVAPLRFPTPTQTTMTLINTPFNLIVPKTGFEIVMTAFVFEANKDVGPDGAAVILYESDAVDSSVSTNDILVFNVAKHAARLLNLGNGVILNEGKWINSTTDDNVINVTLFYYYRPKVR